MKLSVCTLWKCHPFTMFGYPIVTYTWPNRANSGQSERSISIKYPRSSWIGLSGRTLTPSMRSMRFPGRNSTSGYSLSRHAGGVGTRGTPLRGDNGRPGIIPWPKPAHGRAHPQDATQDRPRRRATGRQDDPPGAVPEEPLRGGVHGHARRPRLPHGPRGRPGRRGHRPRPHRFLRPDGRALRPPGLRGALLLRYPGRPRRLRRRAAGHPPPDQRLDGGHDEDRRSGAGRHRVQQDRPGGLDGDRAGGDRLAPEGVSRGADVPDERADRSRRRRRVLDDRLPDRRRRPGEGTGEPNGSLVPPADPAVHRGPGEPWVVEGRALLRVQGGPPGADHGGAGQPRPTRGPRPRSVRDEDVREGRGGARDDPLLGHGPREADRGAPEGRRADDRRDRVRSDPDDDRGAFIYVC